MIVLVSLGQKRIVKTALEECQEWIFRDDKVPLNMYKLIFTKKLYIIGKVHKAKLKGSHLLVSQVDVVLNKMKTITIQMWTWQL
jgi:hypothetical protein